MRSCRVAIALLIIRPYHPAGVAPAHPSRLYPSPPPQQPQPNALLWLNQVTKTLANLPKFVTQNLGSTTRQTTAPTTTINYVADDDAGYVATSTALWRRKSLPPAEVKQLCLRGKKGKTMISCLPYYV
jgi:hypothetical protein